MGRIFSRYNINNISGTGGIDFMIIKNITSDDIEIIGRIYLEAFRYPEGMIRYMGGFEQYVSFL
jgi:hypothetical protein